MKKSIFVFFLVCIGLTAIRAQQLPELPDDPRVKTGRLANGLSYIIIKNEAQKGKATFCVAQKVGTSLEKEGVYGSFELLRMLAMRGTRHFEGKALEEYFFRLGLPAENVTFLTGKDNLIYTIKDMPLLRESVVDSSLLILYNWMSSINVDEDDLEEAKQILHNKIIHGRSAKARLNFKEMKELYPKSPYAATLSPENIESFNKLSSKDLRSFYYTWCRPGLQCVIVVGDVAPEKLETQIKSLFSTIPKSASLETRRYYTPIIPKGVKTVLVTDKEYNNTNVSINLLKEPLKKEYRASSLPLIQAYMDDAITRLLADRIREGALRENLPIYEVKIQKDKFLGMKNTSSYTLSFETLPNYVYAALSFFSGEIDKMGQYGFSAQEFHRSIEIYYRQQEALYDTKDSLNNDIYLQRAVNHFLEGYSLASTELRFEIMKEVLYSLSLNDLNSYARALLKQTDGVVISCKMPDVEGLRPLSKERLLSSYALAIGKTPSHYSDLPIVEWPAVSLESSSTIVGETEDASSGSHVLYLSNGATIVLKNTSGSKDTVAFKAASRGGFSLMQGVNIGNEEFFNKVLNIGGLGSISGANLKKLYNYNHLDLSALLKQNTEELNGYALERSVEKLLQAVYLSFTERRADKSGFEQYKNAMAYKIMYHSVSPLGILQDSVYYYNNSNKAFVAPLRVGDIEKYDYNTLLSQFNARFSNAADFVFIFAGKDIIEYKDLIVKYIGGIRGDVRRKEDWQVLPNYISKGKADRRFMVNMEVPRSYVSLVMSAPAPFNVKTKMLLEVLKRYVERFSARELYKYTTSSTIKVEPKYYPEDFVVMSALFETDSVAAEKVKSSVIEALGAVTRFEVPEIVLAGLIKDVLAAHREEMGRNSYWVDALALKHVVGRDMIGGYESESIDIEEFAEFVANLLLGNRTTLIMDGTLVDIPTAKLWQEDKFIREFFDIK